MCKVILPSDSVYVILRCDPPSTLQWRCLLWCKSTWKSDSLLFKSLTFCAIDFCLTVIFHYSTPLPSKKYPSFVLLIANSLKEMKHDTTLQNFLVSSHWELKTSYKQWDTKKFKTQVETDVTLVTSFRTRSRSRLAGFVHAQMTNHRNLPHSAQPPLTRA